MIHADIAEGPWSKPHLLLAGKGLIDPCPLWDDDGRAYLIHAWAKSRAGFNNVLTLHEMAPDATHVLDAGRTLIDGNRLRGYTTLEGPKLYKRNGYYYVFAPAGGVKDGFQAVFRATSIQGPYEDRIVLDQGQTPVNGPHQGAWVETPAGEPWFLHFQERSPFGRIVHLQPMQFRDGFPVIGEDADGDGKGQPVLRHAKPRVTTAHEPRPMLLGDEFDEQRLSDVWQWSGNFEPSWFSLDERPGFLRLKAQPLPSQGNLWWSAAVLTQRLPGPAAEFSTEIDVRRLSVGARAGLVVLGDHYRTLELERSLQGLSLRLVEYHHEQAARGEVVLHESAAQGPVHTLRAEVDATGSVRFSIGHVRVGDAFAARPLGRWVGARIGLFCSAPAGSTASADFDWVRVRRP
ncbi:MAG: family 43 glycosylhydrolase [Polyangiaceae bacterium]